MNLRRARVLWLLLKAMYGTQIAAAAWLKLVRETLDLGGWSPLESIACVSYNAEADSMVVYHGDDFLAEGDDKTLDRLDEVLGAFVLKKAPRV